MLFYIVGYVIYTLPRLVTVSYNYKLLLSTTKCIEVQIWFSHQHPLMFYIIRKKESREGGRNPSDSQLLIHSEQTSSSKLGFLFQYLHELRALNFLFMAGCDVA